MDNPTFENESANYLMKMNEMQGPFWTLQPPELFHRGDDRFHLLDHGIHRVFLVVHLLGQSEYCLRLCLRHYRHPVAVGDDDITRIHHDSVTHRGNLRAAETIVMHRS